MGVWWSSAATLVLLLLAACSESEPFVAPTCQVECFHAADDMRDGSSSDALPTHVEAHSTEKHALGTSGTIYICGPADATLIVQSDVPTGATVASDPLVVSRSSNTGLAELSVTVTSHEDVVLVVEARDDDGSGSTWSFPVDVVGDQWSFR